jgi:hypothetical protein
MTKEIPSTNSQAPLLRLVFDTAAVRLREGPMEQRRAI